MKKAYIFKRSVLACVLIAVFIFAARFTSVTLSPPTNDSGSEKSVYVTLTVECSAVFQDDNYDRLSDGVKRSDALPQDGYFIKEQSVPISYSDSVFDVLYGCCAENGISFDFIAPTENLYGTSYVKGIGGLYEGEISLSSGWIYSVDGAFPDVGMSDYPLGGGEEIVVEFALN